MGRFSFFSFLFVFISDNTSNSGKTQERAPTRERERGREREINTGLSSSIEIKGSSKLDLYDVFPVSMPTSALSKCERACFCITQ
jgi:hypothetical protein